MITRRQAIRAVLVLIVLILAGTLGRRYIARRATATRPAPTRATVSIPADRALDSFAISPDGTTLAYAADAADGRPHALPGGAILFTVSQKGRDPHLETLAPAGHRGTRLVPAIGQGEYVSTGQIVYSYLGDLYAVPFDLESLKTTGVPVMFAKGVQ